MDWSQSFFPLVKRGSSLTTRKALLEIMRYAWQKTHWSENIIRGEIRLGGTDDSSNPLDPIYGNGVTEFNPTDFNRTCF